MDFKKISIKALSKQALSKLGRGFPARIMKGEGMQMVVMPHQYSAISKAFLKNKGMNIVLSAPEVEANTVAEIGGEGIFGKKADKFFAKTGIKQAIYKTGAALKPLAMEAIDKAASMAEAYGVPSSVVDLAKKETKGYIDKPEEYQTKKGRKELMGRIKSTAEEAASPYLADAGIDMEQIKDMKKMAKDMKGSKGGPSMSAASLKGDTEEAFLSTLQSYMDKRSAKSAPRPTNPMDMGDQDGIVGNGMIQDIRKGLRKGVGGVGLYAGAASGRGIGTGLYTGAGISSQLKDIGKKFVNQSRNIVGTGHPALESQNLDANFLMSNQMPPSYQRRK